MSLRFYQVTSLPAALQPDSFYFVLNGNYAESYLTDNAGDAKLIGNTVMITELVNQAIASASLGSIKNYPTITARDSETLSADSLVLVNDATLDATVTTGAALYYWNATDATFTKIAEYESLDIVLRWADIQNKPTSSVVDIDDAVTKRHIHSNQGVLDLLTEDGVTGQLLYNTQPVLGEIAWTTNNW